MRGGDREGTGGCRESAGRVQEGEQRVKRRCREIVERVQ